MTQSFNNQKEPVKSIKFQLFEESQQRLLKPLPNKDFIELIEKHNKILKQSINDKRAKQNFKKEHDVTVSDLSKDFMQILNLKRNPEDKKGSDSRYLLCEIDPKSQLYQPIESLRKLLFKESDDEGGESSDSDSFASDQINSSPKLNQFKRQNSLPKRKKAHQHRERSDLELYMDSVEQELKKKINASAGITINGTGGNQQLINSAQMGMDIISHLQEFYQKCFTQFLMELAFVNFDLKNVGQRISHGIDLTFQTLIRHHFHEVHALQQTIEEQNQEIENMKQAYLFLKNDIKMINRIAPQVCDILDKHSPSKEKPSQDVFTFKGAVKGHQVVGGSTQSNSVGESSDFSSAIRKDKTQIERERYLQAIQENEERLQAISQIESMIEIRNSHILQNKPKTTHELNIEKLLPSDAEQSLKNILSDIKTFQDKNLNEMRMAVNVEKDEEDMDRELDKQKKIITKDWTGERNQKIRLIQKKLVDKMALKLDKTRKKDFGCTTDNRFITEEEFERIMNLNTQFHKQLAVNGQVFSLKEKQLAEAQQNFALAEYNWKKSEKQLNDIKLLNSVKKSFLMEIKNEYDDIVLGILNICSSFANEIKGQVQDMRNDPEFKSNELLQTALEIQKKAVDDYLFALLESKKVVNDLAVTQQVQKASKHFQDKAMLLMKDGEIISEKLHNLRRQRTRKKSELQGEDKRKTSSEAEGLDQSPYDTESSTDSVRQVMNSKVEYKNQHLKSFEKAKLNQRYSVGPKILKKQILMISQQLEDKQEARRSNLSGLKQSQENSSHYQMTTVHKQSLFNRRKTITQRTSPDFSSDDETVGDHDQKQVILPRLSSVDRKQIAKDAKYLQDRTPKGNRDDSGLVKKNSPESQLIPDHQLLNQDQQLLGENRTGTFGIGTATVSSKETGKFAGQISQVATPPQKDEPKKPRYNKEADDSIKGKIRRQQEELDKIMNTPINFESFIKNQDGFIRMRNDDSEPVRISNIFEENNKSSFHPELITGDPLNLLQSNSPNRTTYQQSQDQNGLQGVSDQQYEEIKNKYSGLSDDKSLLKQQQNTELAAIEEESEESAYLQNQDIISHLSERKSSRAATGSQLDRSVRANTGNQRKGTASLFGQKHSIFLNNKELISQESQTDQFVDDYGQRLQNILNYLNNVIENQINFKTEIQNLSISLRMLSEAKINTIRQIFQTILKKAYQEAHLNKFSGLNPLHVVSLKSQVLQQDQQRQRSEEKSRGSIQNSSRGFLKGDSRAGNRNQMKSTSQGTQLSQEISQQQIENFSKLSEQEKKDLLTSLGLTSTDSQMSIQNLLNSSNTTISMNLAQGLLDPKSGFNVLNRTNLINQGYRQQIINQGLSINGGLNGKQLPLRVNIQEKLNMIGQIPDDLVNHMMAQNTAAVKYFRNMKEKSNKEKIVDLPTSQQIDVSNLDEGTSQQQTLPNLLLNKDLIFLDDTDKRKSNEGKQKPNSSRNKDSSIQIEQTHSQKLIGDDWQVVGGSQSFGFPDYQIQDNQRYLHGQMNKGNQNFNDNPNLSKNQQNYNPRYLQQLEDQRFNQGDQLNQAEDTNLQSLNMTSFDMKSQLLQPIFSYPKTRDTLSRQNGYTDQQRQQYAQQSFENFSDQRDEDQFQSMEALRVIKKPKLKKPYPFQVKQLTPFQTRQMKSMLSSGNLTDDQKSFYLKILQDQFELQNNQLNRSLNRTTSHSLFNTQHLVLGSTVQAQIGKKGNKKQRLQPIEGIKIPTTDNSSQFSQNDKKAFGQVPSEGNPIYMNRSKSLSQISQLAQIAGLRNFQGPNITPQYLLSDEQQLYNKREQQTSPIREVPLNQLQARESSRQQEREEVLKDIIHVHAQQNKIRNTKASLTYRDRKRSIEDLEKQTELGVKDTQSYSKEGKRLDYLPFD